MAVVDNVQAKQNTSRLNKRDRHGGAILDTGRRQNYLFHQEIFFKRKQNYPQVNTYKGMGSRDKLCLPRAPVSFPALPH